MSILTSCSLNNSTNDSSSSQTENPDSNNLEDIAPYCGDGICQGPELNNPNFVCPQDCDENSNKQDQSNSNLDDSDESQNSFTYDKDTYTYTAVEFETANLGAVTSIEKETFEISIDGFVITQTEYQVTNPTSGAKLDTSVYMPKDTSESYPTIILIPGGTAGKSSFTKRYSDTTHSVAEIFAANGFVVITFSPDGREESTGEEDLNGHTGQDGLYEIYRFAKTFDSVNQDKMGIISYSYGITMATGMLARYQPDISFYMEWEGPANRWYSTFGCKLSNEEGTITSYSCDDEDHWVEREAMRYIPYISVDKFIIVQREDDHAQNSVNHSVDANNLAIEYLDWTRVNGPDNDVNQEYTAETLPVLESSSYQEEMLEYLIEITS